MSLDVRSLVPSDIECYLSPGTVVYEGTMDGRSVAVKRLLRQFYDLAKKEIEVRGVRVWL